MKLFCLACAAAGSFFLLNACTTKVYNQQPAAERTVIERDRPVVTEHEHEPAPVQNEIHVDR